MVPYDQRFAHLLTRIRLTELGRLQFDGLAAATCLADANCATAGPDSELTLQWLGGMRIARAGDPPAGACANVFVGGDDALGAPCDDDAECLTGRCWGCPGICRATAAIGAACGGDAPCADSGVCALQAGGGFRCVPIAPRLVGDACLGICDLFTPPCAACAVGSWCNAGVCALALPLGATCTIQSDEPCLAGLTCLDVVDPICATPLPDGAPCGLGDCLGGPRFCVGSPVTGSSAYQTGICWHDPNSTPCGQGTCPVETYCTDASGAGKCTKFAHLGEPCQWQFNTCLEGYCDGSLQICVPYQPCPMASCAMAWCNPDGTCPAKRLDDPCQTDDDCNAPYNVILGKCAGGTCRAWNAACSYPADTP